MQIVNIQPLICNTNSVVHCKTADEAMCFVRFMRETYPAKCSDWSHGNTWWGAYEDDTCYYPHFEGQNSFLTYGKLGTAIANNYQIYEFSDLTRVEDLPIEQSDHDLAMLLAI